MRIGNQSQVIFEDGNLPAFQDVTYYSDIGAVRRPE